MNRSRSKSKRSIGMIALIRITRGVLFWVQIEVLILVGVQEEAIYAVSVFQLLVQWMIMAI